MHVPHILYLAMCLMATMGTGWSSRQCERATGWYFIFSTLFKLGLGTKEPPVKSVQSFLTGGGDNHPPASSAGLRGRIQL